MIPCLFRLVVGKRPLLLLFTLALLLSACSNELELEVPGEDTVVVYGLLAAGDTAHYVRVERAFRTGGADAGVLAQRPDVLYFDTLNVFLEHEQTGRIVSLSRVDATQEGYPRREGPFTQVPNYLYKVRAGAFPLSGGEQLQLTIVRGADLPISSATTQVLTPLGELQNSPSSPVNMAYDRQVRFSWTHGTEARIFQVSLHIRFQEEVAPGQWEDRRLTWSLAESLRPENEATRSSVTITGEQFYRFLAAGLENSANRRRQFAGIDLEVMAGGDALARAWDLAQVNTGLTAAQFIPEYSNITNGWGVFSSRSGFLRPGLQLNGLSLDSLRNGRYTRNLNFQ